MFNLLNKKEKLSERITLRLTSSEYNKLIKMCNKQKLSQNSIFRRLLEGYDI